MPDTQDNAGNGQALENTSSETITTKDVGDMSLVLGNGTPAGSTTPNTDSSSAISQADQSGSGAAQGGELGNGAGLVEPSTSTNGGASTASASSTASGAEGAGSEGDTGNVDAGASNAGAPANTSNDAPLISSEVVASTTTPAALQSPNSPNSSGSDQPLQVGGLPDFDVIAASNSTAVDQMMAEKSASQIALETAGVGLLEQSPIRGATEGAEGLEIDSGDDSAHDAPLPDHPAEKPIADIETIVAGSAAQGVPAEFIAFVAEKMQAVRDAIADATGDIETHLVELEDKARQVGRVPDELVNFIRHKALLIRQLL
jgi:hypothetical protein